MGRFNFYPSVSLEAGYNSNIFNQPPIDPSQPPPNPVNVPISDNYMFVRVPLEFQLPFRESFWNLAYAPGMNLFAGRTPDPPDPAQEPVDTTQLNGYVHDLNTELELNFSSGSRFGFEGGYLRDYLNTRAFDPGGEVEFGVTDFTFRQVQLEYEHPFNPRHGFQGRIQWRDLDYDEEGLNTFVDYTIRELSLYYLNYVGPKSTVFVDAIIGRNTQERLRIETEEGEWSRDGLEIGFQYRFNEQDATRVDLGYEVLEFENSDDSGYSGLVGRFVYQRAVTSMAYLQAELRREPYQSVFNVNNYYLSDSASLSLLIRPPGRVFIVLAASYQRNAYPDEARQFCRVGTIILPEPLPPGETQCPVGDPVFGDEVGVEREDFLLRWNAGLGFQFSRTAALELSYRRNERDSNIPDANYDTDVIALEFRFGWASNREYI